MHKSSTAIVAGVVVVLIIAGGVVTTINRNDDKNKASKNANSSSKKQAIPKSLVNAKSTTTTPIATDHLTITDAAFNPPVATVKKGSKVNWINVGNSDHTVTADDNSFTSESLSRTRMYEIVFEKAGTYKYHSKDNPALTGTIIVTE